MCRYCHQKTFYRMSSISEEEEEDEEFPSSPEVIEEKIFDCLPDSVQVAVTRTLSSDRTNQMTKTHNDLDAILQLLQEKEKDLELAAKIGQSLLERNKHLMQKTEVMEKYLSDHSDREEQLRHDIVRKNDLLQKFLKDQEDLLLEADSNRSEDEARSSESPSLVRDDSFGTLQDKCHILEQQNTRFILEALHLKEQTATEEQKERQLVADCVQQLMEAKDQITALTDDIGRKAEDNLRQQEEISQLIDTVVDLQRRHTQLSEDNEELQSLLSSSQIGQDELKTQIADLQEKYHECFEILMENQQEMKNLNQKIDTPQPKQSSPATNLDGRDSLAQEIEQSVKRDLASIQEKRQNLARVLQTVRNINVSKGKKPKKVSRPSGSKTVDSSSGFKFNPITDLPRNPSEASLDGAEDSASTSSLDPRYSYSRRSFRKPEKLQIVKPIKGSLTLQQWKKLASPTMNLEQERPGVHVKGDLQCSLDGKHSKEHSDVSDVETDDDQPIQMRIRPKPQEDVSPRTKDEKDKPREAHPQIPTTLTLASLVSEKGIQADSRRGSATASILSQLLNSPSAVTPGTSSVGQVLAEVLQKASEEALVKEPKRAASLRNLANYFSEKEKEGKNGPEAIPEDESPPVSPPNTLPMLSMAGGSTNLGGGILSRLLAGSSGINVGVASPRPIATVAGSSSTPTTSSTAIGPLNSSGFGRTSSGTNLKQLESSGLDPKRRSLDVSASGYQLGNYEVPKSSLPTLRRRASSGDLESMSSSNELAGSYNSLGLGSTRLYRSNSSGSLNDLTQNVQSPSSEGIFGRLARRPSMGSLTDLVQRSQIAAVPVPPPGRMERASSIDLGLAARPGQSPPSPSHFDTNSSFFSGQQSSPGPSKGLFSGARLSSLAGVRGMWSQGRSSSEETPQVVPSVNKSEERLEKINKAFAFEDFGGMGLMSFFGSKKSSQNQ